jgi:Lysylphosphatidylglycerol synthase TM region
MAQNDLAIRWQQIKASLTSVSLWLSFALMFVNWGLEAVKWQKLIKPLEPIPFLRAFKSIFAGCSITMLTPNRVGEYGGRILFIKDEHKLDAIPLTILGSMSQLLVTLVFGFLGVLYFRWFSLNPQPFNFLPHYTFDVLLAIAFFAAICLLLLYLRVKFVINFLQKFSFFKKIVPHLKLLKSFSPKHLLTIQFLSIIRYVVFILQYILLLQALQVNVSFFDSFWTLTLFYLIMAVAPTIGFTEFPVRATASVQLLQTFSTNIIGIQAAALGIFLINLILPAVIGSFLILSVKIVNDNKVEN